MAEGEKDVSEMREQGNRKEQWIDLVRRILMITIASFVMALNLKSFVRTGGLIPGGFNGLTVLLQEISLFLWKVELPFSVINFLLNAIPAVISFKFIGKKFTWLSCLMILLTGVFTDLLPTMTVTTDILLVAVFGGLFNAVAISICLFARATSGGTDFIAIF